MEYVKMLVGLVILMGVLLSIHVIAKMSQSGVHLEVMGSQRAVLDELRMGSERARARCFAECIAKNYRPDDRHVATCTRQYCGG